MTSNILWLIAARSGSKSIKNKNIKDLAGMPLLQYRIKTALSLSENTHIWCSTDTEEYAEIARAAGAYVPFLRPEELSTDSASSTDVVLHAMAYAEKQGFHYDYIGLLEPTSPFVYKKHLCEAINNLDTEARAEAIVAVKESRPHTIFIQDEAPYLDNLARNLAQFTKLGRQAFSKQITPSGGFYISRWHAFKINRTFYTEKTLSYLLPDECCLEIDEPIDWAWATFLIDKGYIDLNEIF